MYNVKVTLVATNQQNYYELCSCSQFSAFLCFWVNYFGFVSSRQFFELHNNT